MIDPDSYRTAKVNRELTRVYKGDEFVGQVRMGMDKLWYAELPGTIGMPAAVHQLLLAHEAMTEFEEFMSGYH